MNEGSGMWAKLSLLAGNLEMTTRKSSREAARGGLPAHGTIAGNEAGAWKSLSRACQREAPFELLVAKGMCLLG